MSIIVIIFIVLGGIITILLSVAGLMALMEKYIKYKERKISKENQKQYQKYQDTMIKSRVMTVDILQGAVRDDAKNIILDYYDNIRLPQFQYI